MSHVYDPRAQTRKAVHDLCYEVCQIARTVIAQTLAVGVATGDRVEAEAEALFPIAAAIQNALLEAKLLHVRSLNAFLKEAPTPGSAEHRNVTPADVGVDAWTPINVLGRERETNLHQKLAHLTLHPQKQSWPDSQFALPILSTMIGFLEAMLRSDAITSDPASLHDAQHAHRLAFLAVSGIREG